MGNTNEVPAKRAIVSTYHPTAARVVSFLRKAGGKVENMVRVHYIVREARRQAEIKATAEVAAAWAKREKEEARLRSLEATSFGTETPICFHKSRERVAKAQSILLIL